MSIETAIERFDKLGEAFLAGPCDQRCLEQLVRMYDLFTPKGMAQGLPPESDTVRRHWIQSLMHRGEHFAAWKQGECVGHCALIVDLARKDAEYVIFVLGPYRNRGIGSELTRLAMERALELGITTVWLTVECFNFRAIRVYRKVGFQFCDQGERERTMVLYL